MHTVGDYVPGSVSEPDLLRHHIAVALAVAVRHAGSAVERLAHVYGRVDIPLLTQPQIAKEIVQIPAFETVAHILEDERWGHRTPKRGSACIPRIGFSQTMDIVLHHLLGDREVKGAKILTNIDVACHATILGVLWSVLR